MSDQKFMGRLSLLTFGVAITIASLHFLPSLAPYQDLGWLSMAVFTILCLLMYRFGKAAIQHENKSRFTLLFMSFTGLKMFLAVLLIGIYYKVDMPSSKLFIVPFFAIYAVYTVFEVWFMTRLAKLQTPTK